MKTDQEIEQMLIKGRDLSLRGEEKMSMKAVLLDRAAQTHNYQPQPIVSPWTSWITRGSVAFASLLFIATGTGYASQNSLPGEPLYAVKVNMVEEMVERTKLTPRDRIAYDMLLMETRLSEIKTVIDQNEELQTDDYESLTDQVEEHVEHITKILSETEDSVMSYEEKIQVLSTLSGVSKAQVRVTEDDEDLAAISDTLEETHESASNALVSTVEDFVQEEAPEVINDYISDQITEVGVHAQASSTNTHVRDSALHHIYDVDEALTDGNTSEAFISILEAQEVFTVDNYLKDRPADTKPD